MKKPIWFRVRPDRRGWTPCAWQGWVVIGLFIAALLTAMRAWGGSSPGRLVVTALFFIALIVGTAALTSEDVKRGD